MYAATIQLTQIGADDGACILGDDQSLTVLLHRAFREMPEFKRICTEALLTFDTEAGGETMNLQSAETGKEDEHAHP